MVKKKPKIHNDGVAYFGKRVINRNEAGYKTGESYEQVCNLLFSKVSVSERDLKIAKVKEKVVSLKIKVPQYKISSNYVVRINSQIDVPGDENLYEIINIDEGTDKELYLLLQKVKLNE